MDYRMRSAPCNALCHERLSAVLSGGIIEQLADGQDDTILVHAIGSGSGLALPMSKRVWRVSGEANEV